MHWITPNINCNPMIKEDQWWVFIFNKKNVGFWLYCQEKYFHEVAYEIAAQELREAGLSSNE